MQRSTVAVPAAESAGSTTTSTATIPAPAAAGRPRSAWRDRTGRHSERRCGTKEVTGEFRAAPCNHGIPRPGDGDCSGEKNRSSRADRPGQPAVEPADDHQRRHDQRESDGTLGQQAEAGQGTGGEPPTPRNPSPGPSPKRRGERFLLPSPLRGGGRGEGFLEPSTANLVASAMCPHASAAVVHKASNPFGVTIRPR